MGTPRTALGQKRTPVAKDRGERKIGGSFSRQAMRLTNLSAMARLFNDRDAQNFVRLPDCLAAI
jgi:hypothetical protein